MVSDVPAHDLIGFDNVTLKGDPVIRAIAVLRLARHQVRLALQDAISGRMEAALSDIEDELAVHLGRIDDAADDDVAEAEASGAAQARRQAWLPLRAA